MNTVDLPEGFKAVAMWTGHAFRCVVVDKQGKSAYKHFALWGEPCLDLVARVNETRQIRKDLWFDADGKALASFHRAWEFLPRVTKEAAL